MSIWCVCAFTNSKSSKDNSKQYNIIFYLPNERVLLDQQKPAKQRTS